MGKSVGSSFALDFDRATIKSLRRKGITIIGATYLPDEKGSYLNGQRGYCLDDNGTHRIRPYLEVKALAAVQS